MTRAPFPDTLPWHARSDPNHGREIRLSFAMRLQKKPQAVSQGNISSKEKLEGKARSSKLKGKNPIRSASNFELPASNFQLRLPTPNFELPKVSIHVDIFVGRRTQ
jgi:hypothetical protein